MIGFISRLYPELLPPSAFHCLWHVRRKRTNRSRWWWVRWEDWPMRDRYTDSGSWLVGLLLFSVVIKSVSRGQRCALTLSKLWDEVSLWTITMFNNNINYISLSLLFLDSMSWFAFLCNYFIFALSSVASMVCYFVINCRSVAQTKSIIVSFLRQVVSSSGASSILLLELVKLGVDWTRT